MPQQPPKPPECHAYLFNGCAPRRANAWEGLIKMWVLVMAVCQLGACWSIAGEHKCSSVQCVMLEQDNVAPFDSEAECKDYIDTFLKDYEKLTKCVRK